MKKQIIFAIAVIGSIVTIGGVLWAGMNWVASKADVEYVQDLVVKNSAEDARYRAARRYKELQAIKWQYDREFGIGCARCPASVATEYRDILSELEILAAKLGYDKK